MAGRRRRAKPDLKVTDIACMDYRLVYNIPKTERNQAFEQLREDTMFCECGGNRWLVGIAGGHLHGEKHDHKEGK